MAKFNIKRGLEANIPSTIANGVLYFCTDTGNLYIDIDGKRKQISSEYAKGLKVGDTAVEVNTEGDLILSAHNEDRYIYFNHDDNSTRWRTGVEGSGSGNANYFVIESDKMVEDGEFSKALKIGIQDLASTFGGTVTAPSFVGPLTGNASSATKLANARTISLTGDVTGSASFNGSANVNISATVADDSHNHIISNVDGLQDALNNKSTSNHGIYYGTCSTAASTVAKEVVLTDTTGFTLNTGSVVIVKFTNTNSASNPTLNVNSTGAKSIMRYGTTAAGSSSTTSGWQAGSVIIFVYDGTNWIRDYWYNTTYSNAALGQGYATCSTAAATVAKTGTLSGYSLAAGGIVSVKFTYAVPANATLNINSRGAKAIFYRGAAITANIIKAGDIATFIYDGTQYHLTSIDRWQNDINDISEDLDNSINGLSVSGQVITYTKNDGSTGTITTKDTTYTNATTTTSGLMSSDDKTYFNKLKQDNLGSFSGKTIADLRTAIETWLSNNLNVINATAYFSASEASLLEGWNSGDTSATIEAGSQWSITVDGGYSSVNYVGLKLASYSNNVYHVIRGNGVWQSIQKFALTENASSSAVTYARKLGSSTVGSSTKPIYLSEGSPVTCSTYAGGTAVTLNGASKAASTASFYAPISAGTKDYILTSAGSGAPVWAQTLPIANGGTGATSAASARTNLSVYSKTEVDNAVAGVKNDLLNGAGAAYDTLKELGDLIDDNTDAINALETIASNKQDKITGAASTIVSSNLTASRALISNSSGKVAVSAVTSTELEYLDGVTSSIQTQLNNRLLLSGGTITGGLYVNNSNSSTDNGLFIRRSASTSEQARQYIDDAHYYFNYTNDETSQSIVFNMTSTDTESGSGENPSTSSVTFSNANNISTVTAGIFSGSGASLTSLNASNISSGTLSSSRLPTIPASKGGTGQTSLINSANALINALGEGDKEPTDTTYIITQGGEGYTDKFYRRPASLVWEYIKDKISSTLGLTSSAYSGNAATATKLTTSAGSATQPVYFSGGKPVACTYTLGKSVPSDAVFTDTKNTAGSSNTSNKIFLIGATSQASSATTYSHDTAYVGSDGHLYSNSEKVAPHRAGVYFVKGTGTTAGTWLGSSEDITEYYDGLTIAYEIGIAGASTTTLNINSLGAKTCYRYSTAKITTHYPVGTVIILVYSSTKGAWYATDYDSNSDTKVTQTVTTTDAEYPLLASTTASATTTATTTARFASGITLNPAEGSITATNFKGTATAATTATKDGSGNVITSTYSTKPNTLKGASISGKTITFTKGDGSTFTITTQDTTYSAATTSAAGLMSAADKTKLNGIATGAEVNQNAFSNVVVGSTTIAADSKTDTITLVAGDNITLTPNATNDSITITAKDDNTTYSNATTSAAGLMSAADKVKLNGIEAGAQVNTVTSVAGRTGAVTLSKSDVGLDQVTNESKATMFTSAALTGTPTAPTATTGTNTTQIATTAFVNATVNDKIAAADAMIYKGTIGTGGTVTSLPATHKTGWTYKVATAGTYAGVVCEVGDLIICLTDGTTSTNSHWTVVQTNVDGTVTGPASAVANRVAVFDGTTGKIIKDSGFTIGASVPSDAKFTDTTYSFSTSNPTLAWGTTSTIGSAGGVTYKVTMPANPNSHYTTKMYATSSAGTAHATTTNGNTYLRLFDNTTARSSINIKGSGATTVTSNDSGVITISSTNTTYSNATTGSAGLMSAADKTKLDGIANNANNYTYTLPNATSSTLGGVKIGSNITVSSGTISLTKANVTNALGYTPPTTNTTYSAGSGLSLSSTTFNVGAGAGITVNADSVALSTSGVTAGSYGPSANATPGYGVSFNVPYITVDAYGRVTGASTKTVKIPASDNTDVNVTQTVRTTNGAFPLLLRGTSAGTSTVTTTTSFASSITANPSTGTVAATIFDASTEVDIGDCKLVYDSTNKCLNFVF